MPLKLNNSDDIVFQVLADIRTGVRSIPCLVFHNALCDRVPTGDKISLRGTKLHLEWTFGESISLDLLTKHNLDERAQDVVWVINVVS